MSCSVPQAALEVTVIDMPQLPERVGETYWAGQPFSLDLGSQGLVDLAEVTCADTPTFAEYWPSGLHLFGAPIVPDSTYEIRLCWGSGDSCSDPAIVGTGKWGDVVEPLGGATQPNFADIAAVVDCFKNASGAPPFSACDLYPTIPDHAANFGDISADVDAFKGLSYPGDPCP